MIGWNSIWGLLVLVMSCVSHEGFLTGLGSYVRLGSVHSQYPDLCQKLDEPDALRLVQELANSGDTARKERQKRSLAYENAL